MSVISNKFSNFGEKFKNYCEILKKNEENSYKIHNILNKSDNFTFRCVL